MDDSELLAHAVTLAEDNVTAGGLPFGAVVARNGEILGTGVNRALQDHDPSAHAELLAIRQACRRLEGLTLAGATVYASGQPCPMCQASALLAGVERLLFAAAASQWDGDAAVAALLGELAAPFGERRRMPVVHIPIAGAERAAGRLACHGG
ncbi:MAG: nucleoside deaminase [Solirubrobacteraceae bacterium]